MYNMEKDSSQMDTRYSWVLVTACGFTYTLFVGSAKTFTVLYTELLETFDRGAGNTAWVPSIALFLLMVLGPLTNHLCIVYSFRTCIILGGFFCSLGYFLSYFVTKIEWMYLTYGIVTGFGYGLLFPSIMTLVNYYVEKRRALANGIIVAGGGVGLFILPYLYRVLINEYGLRGSFILYSGILLHICIAGVIIRQPIQLVKKRETIQIQENEICTEVPNKTSENSAMDHPKNSNAKNNKFLTKLVASLNLSDFQIPSFTIICVSLILHQGAYIAAIITLSPQIVSHGFSKEEADFVVSMAGIGEIISRIFFGWFADVKCVKLRHIYVVNVFISGFTSIVVSFFALYPVQIIYGIVMGLFSGAYLSLISVMVIDAVGMERLPQALGKVLFLISSVNILTAPLSGWFKDMTGSWDLSLRFFGCCSVLGGVLVMLDPLITKFWCYRLQELKKFDEIPTGVKNAAFDTTEKL